MSRLDELIKQFCPDGVEYKTLEDIATYRRGSFPQPYGRPQWYGGEDAMPFVQVADVREDFKLVEDTKQKISKLAQPKSIFVPKDSVIVTLQGTIGRVAITQYDSYVDRTLAIFEDYKIEINKKFFAYVLKQKFDIEKKHARGSTLKTITKEEFSKFPIPVPPMPVQEEIVRILDSFTELTTELTAELTARKKQYEYYREELLAFDNKVKTTELNNLCLLITKQTGFDYSATIKPSLITENRVGYYPFIQNKNFNGANINYNTDFYVPEEVVNKYPKITLNCPSILITLSGNIGNIGYYNTNRIAFIGGAVGICKLKQDVNGKFIMHYLSSKHGQTFLKKSIKAGSHLNITVEAIRKIPIPFPPLEEQKRIVDILDRFDQLCNDITEGLPAEIEARQKQYEYYRDKLLTFKEKTA